MICVLSHFIFAICNLQKMFLLQEHICITWLFIEQAIVGSSYDLSYVGSQANTWIDKYFE